MSTQNPALAIASIDLAIVAILWRQTTLLAQMAGFIVTGLSTGMASYSAELTRWALATLLHRRPTAN